MTTQQLHLFNCLYLVITAAVTVLTRATPRRIVGAMAGSTACGAMAIFILASGVVDQWWHIVMRRDPYFLMLLWIDFALCGYVFLLTWRIARRFGWIGLAAVLFLSAIVGPARDYEYLAMFPKWGSHAPGLVPVLGISGGYVFVLILGHGVMRVIAGPSKLDRLASRPWETRQSCGVSKRVS